jgi:hypothetical protein
MYGNGCAVADETTYQLPEPTTATLSLRLYEPRDPIFESEAEEYDLHTAG